MNKIHYLLPQPLIGLVEILVLALQLHISANRTLVLGYPVAQHLCLNLSNRT